MNTECAADEVLLDVRALRLIAGTRTLVDGLSCELRRGELWCVLGPNGSGKTTLLHALAGLRAPQGGAVTFRGRPWSAWELRAAGRQRGLLLQQQQDAFGAAVAEVVAMYRHAHVERFRWPGEDDRRAVAEALQAMELEDFTGRNVRTLSGGERQRVALAAVLAQDPDLLLLDEPSAHLDLAHQARAFAHMDKLVRNRRRAVVFATHDYNLAQRFATHALLLDGRGHALHGPSAQLLQPERLSHLFGFPIASLRSPQASGLVPQW
jgi:iron complex transport system ATP-binding protein